MTKGLNKYSVKKGLIKGVRGAVIGGLAGGGAAASQTGVDTETAIAAVTTSLLGAGFEFVRNWIKQH